ncbi:MAM domain-containing glycosylphosphatidylinositol anchor protein 2, partial [Manacus vitellinus]
LDDPIVTVHQSIGEAKEQFYYEKTVFLRCVANSNPPVRYSWRRGQEVLLQGSDKGVEIYEPFFTQDSELATAVGAKGRGDRGHHPAQTLPHIPLGSHPSKGHTRFPCAPNRFPAFSGKAYAPEFYYDTYNPLWQNRPRVYSYSLQWTQMNPNAVDRILAYRLGIRQAGQQRWWEQEITVNGNIQKGELITYNLTELIKPEAYEVRLTPITRFGEGDSTIRVIKYSAPVNPHLREFHCGFEDGNICLFTQDDTDNFDWTKQSTATRDTKYTPNTGPNADRTGSKEGFYMYIETSRPRLEGEKARLVSPVFSVAPKNPYGATNTAYCFSFYYHMYGQHIGERKPGGPLGERLLGEKRQEKWPLG